MPFMRFYYEIRLLGWRVLLTPLLLLAGYALIAKILLFGHQDPSRFLSSYPELLLPVIAGITIVTIVSYDNTMELLLTFPRPYRTTALLRLLLLCAWFLLISFALNVLLATVHLSFLPRPVHPFAPAVQFMIAQLVWLIPLLWFTAVGLCTSILLRSRAAGTSLLGGIWLLEIIFKDSIAIKAWSLLLFPTTLLALAGPLPQPIFDNWLLNRLILLSMALAFFLLGWLLLHNNEGLLKGSSEE